METRPCVSDPSLRAPFGFGPLRLRKDRLGSEEGSGLRGRTKDLRMAPLPPRLSFPQPEPRDHLDPAWERPRTLTGQDAEVDIPTASLHGSRWGTICPKGHLRSEGGQHGTARRSLMVHHRSGHPVSSDAIQGPSVEQAQTHQLDTRPTEAHSWITKGSAGLRPGCPGRERGGLGPTVISGTKLPWACGSVSGPLGASISPS